MPGTLSLVICAFCCTVNLFAYSEKNDSTFVASREWQIVKKGQPIPSGLHVRHNFQTGLTEAKLLDDEAENNSDEHDNDDRQTKSLALHPDQELRRSEYEAGEAAEADSNKEEADKLKITLERLKARLKKIRRINREIKAIERTNDRNEAQERLKSYTNLKNEFKVLEVNVTTDGEMLVNFFQRFESHRDSVANGLLTSMVIDDVLQILNNLEYLLHQIDNAQMFADMGGMAKIISPCFNTSNDAVKSEALRLLGTAVQSNPKVQAKALEHDFVQKLLHMLAVNNKVAMQSRCLFALSALVRQYPTAQKALVDHGGFEIFGQILEDGHPQTQSRIMNLMSDLVVERAGLGKIEDEIVRRRKTREYSSTDFDNKLIGQKYCRHLSNLMVKSFVNEAEAFGDSNMENHEFLAVILDSMITLGSTCKSDFRAERRSLLALIKEAQRRYESAGDASSEEDDYPFGHLALQLGRLRKTVFEDINDEF